MKLKINPWEKASFEDDTVNIDDVSVQYMQNPDCTEDSDGDPQTIIISSRNNGIARFINISTTNWSIGSVDELVQIINDFCNRAGIDLNKEQSHEEI